MTDVIKKFCQTNDEKFLSQLSPKECDVVRRVIIGLGGRGDPERTLILSKHMDILKFLIINVFEMLISHINSESINNVLQKAIIDGMNNKRIIRIKNSYLLLELSPKSTSEKAPPLIAPTKVLLMVMEALHALNATSAPNGVPVPLSVIKKHIIQTYPRFKTGDEFKVKNYHRAILAFKKADYIRTENDALIALQNIGFISPSGIMKKVQIILQYGTLPSLEEYRQSYFTIKILASLPWVGEITALKWYELGVRNIGDVANLPLTTAQKYGYKYYNDLIDPVTLDSRRIPRSEIIMVDRLLRRTKIDYVIAGSYRRELATSGDIDVIIRGANNFGPSSPKNYAKNLFDQLSGALVNAGYEFFAITEGKSKLLGLYRIPGGLMRRIDFLVCSPETYPYALLYFTGSVDFNRRMRLHALKQGWKLNEYGLFNKDGIFMNTIARTEKEIFAFLNLPYVEPKNRI